MNTAPTSSEGSRQPYSVGKESAAALPNRILIDCTHTVQSGLQTGVQRVVRSLVREGSQLGQERGQTVMGVVLGRAGFEKYCPGTNSESHTPPPTLRDDVLHHLPQIYVRLAEWMCRGIKSTRIRSWFLPKRGHLGVFKPVVKLIELARKLARRELPGQLGLGKGDMLILADAYWSKMELFEQVRAARAKGAFAVTVIHDIIPLTHPQFVPRRCPGNFRKYLWQAVINSDLIVAVSQTIRDQLREKLPEIFPDAKSFPPVEAFRNGANFEDKGQPVREELIDLFSPRNQPTPYLSVSTFDPRKNHGYTLEAFEMLWSRGADVRLVFVGGRGWMSEDLLNEIEKHPELGKRLYVFHDLSDSELFYCYQRARGTISASFVEGFGLPIVESLWHGRKTFASDTPVHREVGGDDVIYFGLSSPEFLSRAIGHWEKELAAGASVKQPQVAPMNWRESTELLLEKSLAAYAEANRGVHSKSDQKLAAETPKPLARAA